MVLLVIKLVMLHRFKAFFRKGREGKGREGLKKTKKQKHFICDHDHTLTDPPPSFFKTVIASGYFFSRRYFINWVIQECLETHFGYVGNKLWLGKA